MLTFDKLVLEQRGFSLSADHTVPSGITALIGPSGGGKSTLLSGIAGFLMPAAGRVLFEGRDLTPLAPGDRPVSILFQDNNLFPHLTVGQSVGLALRPDLRLDARQSSSVSESLAKPTL